MNYKSRNYLRWKYVTFIFQTSIFLFFWWSMDMFVRWLGRDLSNINVFCWSLWYIKSFFLIITFLWIIRRNRFCSKSNCISSNISLLYQQILIQNLVTSELLESTFAFLIISSRSLEMFLHTSMYFSRSTDESSLLLSSLK